MNGSGDFDDDNRSCCRLLLFRETMTTADVVIF